MFLNRVNTKCQLTILFLFIGLFIMFLYGCGSKDHRSFGGSITPGTGQISGEQLRKELNDFENYYRSFVTEEGDKIDLVDPRVRNRKTNLILRTRSFQTINTMLEQDDPVVAFIETWGFIIRVHQYLAEGEGSLISETCQHILVDMGVQLEARIESIGRLFMTEEVFDETRKNLHIFARTNPLKSSFSNTLVYATRVEPGTPGPFTEVIGIPMAPITALHGVDRTASAINYFADTAANFSNVTEELPESMRWQLLTLLYDFEESDMTKSFLTSVTKLSDSSEQLAETAKNLPQDIHKQTSLLIEEIDDKQANLQTTIDKVQQTVIQADKTAQSFQDTVGDINLALNSWDKAANSTQQALSEFGKLKSTDKKTSDEPSMSVKDIQDILERVDKTAVEMKSIAETVNNTAGGIENITAQIHEIIESKQLADYASMPRELVKLLIWGLGLLVVLIFMLAVVYRIIGYRLAQKLK